MTGVRALSAADRCQALAAAVKGFCDDVPGASGAEVRLAAGLWHAAAGLEVLARMGRGEACEAVLARVADALSAPPPGFGGDR